MFPYTAEEAEWLSTPADRHYWLLGRVDFRLTTPLARAANDPPLRSRDKVAAQPTNAS
ncbi:MAG TPA: hypothetical protein VE914_14850 [Candidatus Angelobacter sp.]|nr:hypothetical protein [Candidatus Angelobacter sp.]